MRLAPDGVRCPSGTGPYLSAMPPSPARTGDPDPLVPSMLDLVRLSPRLLFPPGGVDLYRQIALLTGMSEGQEVLDVACGKGVSLEYFVREYGMHGSGVDFDPRMVEEAEERAREAGLGEALQFQRGASDALPYRDEIFDIAVGELGLAAHCDPMDAVRELVRVTRPGGFVVLVQLVWKASVDERRQDVLTGHLGARPLMLVEWKRLLREAGVSDLHTENWSDDETAFRSEGVKPFPDFAEIFSLPEKIGILRRAWRQWGWKGVRTVVEREREIHRLLDHERILGLDLLKGRKGGEAAGEEAAEDLAPEASDPQAPQSQAPQSEASRSEAPESQVSEEDVPSGAPGGEEPAPTADPETAGLPLFGDDET